MPGAKKPLPEELPVIEALERDGYEFEIDIHGWGFHHLKDEALKLVQRLKTIAFLDLFEVCDVGGVSDEGLSYLAGNRSLVSLRLGPGIGDGGLAHLVGLMQLEELWVHTGEEDKDKITDRGMLYVSKLTNLESFSIGFCRVGDAGVELLTVLTNLRELGLWNSEITDGVIPTLAKFSQLADLDLGYTRITDSVIPKLAKFSQLTKLNVSHTAMTKNGLETLMAALPNCQIR